MSSIQLQQQSNNNNNYFWQLWALLDVNENGRLVFPFSRRLVLIDRPFEIQNQNHNNQQNETSDDNDNTESEFSSSSSLSEDYFLTDDDHQDDNNEDDGSWVSLSLPPTPFAYDPYDSYDWEC